MAVEPNWWSGQTGPIRNSNSNKESSEAKEKPASVISEFDKKNQEPESKTFLSTDKSGHWVPDAYQKMLERMKRENPSSKPKREEVLSRVAQEERNQNIIREQTGQKEQKIGGSRKYILKLKAALQSVIDGESSMNLVMPIREISKVEFRKAGKNKDGEPIYEVCEDNVTLGYSDHTIY